VSDPQAYIETWHKERLQNFEAHREAVLGHIAARYQALSVRFDKAYARLEENKDLWTQWSNEEKAGTRSPRLADVQLRKQIENDLAVIRQVSWSLERVHHRLDGIETRLGPEVFVGLKVKMASGDWAHFVESWHGNRENLESRLAMTHYRVKLFVLRHGGPLVRPDKLSVERSLEKKESREPARRR
jgi:hypothetical protein